MKENIEVLEEVLDVLEDEKRKFYDLVNHNEFRIEEINSYLRELSKKEDEDFKVFSPRNVQNIHREQIEVDMSEIKKCEEENKNYSEKIEALKNLIDKVNAVIGNLQIFEENEKQQNKENSEEIEYIDNDESSNENSDVKEKFTLENNHIAHQILNCVSFIIPDPERAKIELTALSKKIME